MNYFKIKFLSVSTNYLIPLLIFFPLLFFITIPLNAQKADDQLNDALISAELFFKSLTDKNFVTTWSLITQKSKNTIANDVFKEIQKNKSSRQTAEDYTLEQIMIDFKVAGPLSKSYWINFLVFFNPDLVLNQSKWDIGAIKKDKAELNIKYRKSDNPAILQMFRENGEWKVGLVETFWTRK